MRFFIDGEKQRRGKKRESFRYIYILCRAKGTIARRIRIIWTGERRKTHQRAVAIVSALAIPPLVVVITIPHTRHAPAVTPAVIVVVISIPPPTTPLDYASAATVPRRRRRIAAICVVPTPVVVAVVVIVIVAIVITIHVVVVVDVVPVAPPVRRRRRRGSTANVT
jgi:hypothetical protein